MYIASLDAKDIYLANNTVRENPTGFTLLLKDGKVNYRKFINTLPYSLDLIKLREVYERAYRNRGFSWFNCDKEYSTRVINVTFKYAVKEYNRIADGIYVKIGYTYNDINLVNCVDVRDGELIAVKVDVDAADPVNQEVLGKFFYHDGSQYKTKGQMPAMMTRADLREKVRKFSRCRRSDTRNFALCFVLYGKRELY